MISSRTKASLCMYLTLHEPAYVSLLMARSAIETHGMLRQATYFSPSIIDDLITTIDRSNQEDILSLLTNMVSTSGDLRVRISPKYQHDERWKDLLQCLLLDGFKIQEDELHRIEPTLNGTIAIEDDLGKELKQSNLGEVKGIIRALQNSAEDFRKAEPDYNGCLTNARVALQTLAKSVAKFRQTSHDSSHDDRKWGQVLAFLRTSGLIDIDEEKGISGVFDFTSPGAHRPVGIEEKEMARLGRSLVVSMCYYLIRLHNSSSH